jgi:uncharacterized membrane protein YgcG
MTISRSARSGGVLRKLAGAGAVLTLGCLLAGARAAAAQSAPDPHWSDWVGCWDLLTDGTTTRQTSPEDAAQNSGATRPAGRRDARVCVEPRDGGAELQTLVGGQQVLTQVIVADGKDRTLSEPECNGTQRAQWSADGLRLFSRAQITCGTQPPRTVSGLSLLTQDGQWIDVQAVTIDGRDSVRVRRFRSVKPQVPPPAAAVRLTTDHVKEASGFVASRALEAALVETGARFPMSSKVLLDLDKAHVPESVIDLMVALSYPQSFAVQRSEPDDRLTGFPLSLAPGGDFVDASLDSPFFYGSYYYSPYFFSPFGYSYLRYYPGFVALPIAVTVPGEGGGVPGKADLPEVGRAVNGRGYTKVYPRDHDGSVAGGSPSPTPRSGTASRGTVSPRGYTAGDSGSSSSSGSSSGSSGGSSAGSSGGGSSSGSSDGGGRTAVPR